MNDISDMGGCLPLNTVLGDMRRHGLNTPLDRVMVSVPGAKAVVTAYFEHFLSDGEQRFTWLPEYDEVAEWLGDNKGRGLFLYGNCGRGKSMLARNVIPAILFAYHNKVVTVADVSDMNRDLDTLLQKHIIALDDIGTESVSVVYGNKRLAFAEVMDAAEKYGKLIIVTSNLRKEEIIARYGMRIFDRIISTTKRVEFKGLSLRR